MTIGCDHPRPKLNMPGYTAPRFRWQPPAVIPSDAAGMARAILEGFRGIYAVLQDVGKKRTVVPLIEDIDAREGQFIVGVGDGQVIRLPALAEHELGLVSVILTDVISPVSVINPDGSEVLLRTTGSYDFVSGEAEGSYLTPPGTTGGSLGALLPGAPVYDVMVEPFNAAGDGSTDDLAAINAAIAAANATPGVIYLGTSHLISGALDPITGSCIWLRGRGMDGGGTTITCTTAPTSIITIGSGARMSGVSDLRVGSSVASQSGYAVRLTQAFRCFAWNIRTLTSGSGVEVDRCNTTYIENIDVTDALGPYGFHIHGTNPDFNHVTRLHRCQAGRSYPLSINAGRGDWATGTAYALGDVVRANGGLWQCSTAGTSSGAGTGPGSAGLPSALASTVHTTTVTDGSAVWRYAMGAFEGFAHGSYAHTVLYQQCGVLQGYRGWYVFDDAGAAPTFIHGWQCSADHTLVAGIHLEACDGAVMFDQTLSTSILTSGQPGIAIGANATRWQFNGGEANQGITIAGTAGVLRGMHTSTIAMASTVASGVLVENNHLTGALTIAAGADNYVVTGNRVGGGITNTPGRADTRVVQGNIPDTEIAVGSVWGLQIDHGASDVPREVTKFELGENLRRETVVVDTTSSGTSATYTIASTTTQVQFKLASELTINGMTAATLTFGKLVVFSFDSGFAGSVTWNNESGSAGAALERVRTPGGVALTISAGETVVFEYFDSRWRCISVARANGITDGDKGDITVSSSGTVWNIDANVVGDAELRQGVACSVIGRSANSTGNVADIQGATNDRLLARTSDTLSFQQLTNGMVPTNTVGIDKLANQSAGTVLGRAVDAGTGAVTALSGLQQGQNLRRETVVTDTTSSGTSATYTIANTTTQVQFKLAGALTINGMTASAATFGKLVAFSFDSGFAGSVTWNNESGSAGAALERIRTPGAAALTISAGETALFEYFDSRWRCLAVGKAVTGLSDGDKGDITVSSSGATWTIDNDVVSDAKLRNSGALSVIGRSANSSGDPADIAAGTDGHVLRRSGTTLGFGQIATAGIADAQVTNAKIADRTAMSIMCRSSTSAGPPADIAATPVTDANLVLRLNSAGTDFVFATCATASIADDAITNAKAANMAQTTVKGRAAGAGTGDPTDLTNAQVRAILSASPLSSTSATGTVVVNSTTETAVVSHTMAANTLAVGDTYEMVTVCLVLRAGAATASDLTVRYELNGAAADSFTSAVGTTLATYRFEVLQYFTVTATGGSGTCTFAGHYAENLQNATNPQNYFSGGTGSVAIDTTASNTISFSVQFSAAVASLSVINRRSFIRRIL